MADISMADLAQVAAEKVISQLADTYTLLYVAQGEYLSDAQVQQLLSAGEIDWDAVLDPEWESENRWHGENAVLENLLDKDAVDWLAEHDVLQQVREAIQERDRSDPIGDLMRATGPKLFRYRLDESLSAYPWKYTDDENEAAARALAAAAGVDFEQNADELRELVATASYGGGLHVLWRGDVRPPYEAVCKVRFHEPKPAITVQWTDPELLVLDQLNGSGHAVQVRGVVSLPFDPDRLALDTGRYSWSDVTGGYFPDCDEPEFTESTTEEKE